ncbi:hypothetical protein BH11MYX4_BH11MYX4_01800 [soil metagenome]
MHNTRTTNPRKLRQKPQVTPAASHVSQQTSLALVGIDAPRFLELLRAHPELPRTAVGKLRVVALDDLRDLLSRLAANEGDPVLTSGDDGPTTAAAVLALLGRKLA